VTSQRSIFRNVHLKSPTMSSLRTTSRPKSQIQQYRTTSFKVANLPSKSCKMHTYKYSSRSSSNSNSNSTGKIWSWSAKMLPRTINSKHAHMQSRRRRCSGLRHRSTMRPRRCAMLPKGNCLSNPYYL